MSIVLLVSFHWAVLASNISSVELNAVPLGTPTSKQNLSVFVDETPEISVKTPSTVISKVVTSVAATEGPIIAETNPLPVTVSNVL